MGETEYISHLNYTDSHKRSKLHYANELIGKAERKMGNRHLQSH